MVRRLYREGARLRRDTPVLERPSLLHPFHPTAVEDTQVRVAEIFQHPEHPAFIAPVIERVGIDHDPAVVADPQRPYSLFHAFHIGIDQSLGDGIRIAVVVPGGMDRAGNVPAEFIGGAPAHVDDDESGLAQLILQGFGINQ